jgi:hypothetical protein
LWWSKCKNEVDDAVVRIEDPGYGDLYRAVLQLEFQMKAFTSSTRKDYFLEVANPLFSQSNFSPSQLAFPISGYHIMKEWIIFYGLCKGKL